MAFSWLAASGVEREHQGMAVFLLALTLSASLGGAALVWITVLRNRLSPITAPIYAVLQGVALGVLSVGIDHRYPGIAIRAVGLTIFICVCLLIAYRFRFIRVTESFNRKLSAALAGVIVYFAVTFVIGLLWRRTLSATVGGAAGILISVVIVVIAGLALVSNFDFVVQCAERKLPHYVEWLAAMGLLIALVWLYIEVLDLLSKAQKNRP